MCGIAGYYSIVPHPAGIIGRMTDVIRHRGPDDEGFVLFQELSAPPRICGGRDTPKDAFHQTTAYAPKEKIDHFNDFPVTLAMGHRRLSIVDLSHLGHQPMSSSDGRYWIVFNGEIYNYIELRAELEKIGCSFISSTDTEVIIEAFRVWGKECLSHFNGMFAFLLYDRDQHRIFAARDRFGVKPLYYQVVEKGIAFASEIKQFTVLPQWQARMNGQRVYDYLNWGITDHTDETMFSGVFQLRGGEAIEIDLKIFSERKKHFTPGARLPVYSWYQLKPKTFFGTFEEAANQFREKLTKSIQLRLRSDVKIGSCLSGGLDSSSIVCIANDILRKNNAHDIQQTFSACADEAKFDERKWVDIVVDATGVNAHYVYPQLDGLFDEISEITWHQDEPFGSTSIYAQWNVFRLAAEQNVKVMLDGQGADEQLVGYHSYFGPHLAQLFRSLRWGTLFKEATAMRNAHGYSLKKAVFSILSNSLPMKIKDKLRPFSGATVTQPDWLNIEYLGCKAQNPFISAGAAGAKTVQELSIAQLTRSNLPMLLHWEDRDSMGHSIESRTPFLDYKLVEFVLGLPDDYKLSKGVTKLVMRGGMRGVLPNIICNRTDKLGFVTPEEIWLREVAPDLFRQKIIQSISAAGGILRKEASLKMLDEMIAGRMRYNTLPWRLISFGEWIKRFNVAV